jgi:hypothetical protein
MYTAMGPYGGVRHFWLIADARSQESQGEALASESWKLRWNARTVLLPRRELYRIRSYVVIRRRNGLNRAHCREHIAAGQAYRRGT